MRKLLLASIAFVISSLQAQDYWCLDKRLSVRADYGYLRRQEVRNLRLVEDTSQTGGNGKPKKRIEADELVDLFGWESAIRGILTYHGSACSSLEAQYTYFYPWSSKIEKTADGTLQFPFKDPIITFDFTEADEAVVRYKSRLQNGELNYWWHITPQRVNYFSFSWNIGLRLIFLKETLDLVFKKDENKSLYAIETNNYLYGPQLGAVLEINPSSCWTWTFIVKGAAFLNDSHNEVEIGDFDNTEKFRDYEKMRWTDSLLIEGYGQLAYHWYSWLDLHFAYQGFLLTGLVLAPEQRDIHVSEKRRINTKGQILIDGLYGGLTLRF
ncbi:MAG: hypothetical protein KR126chlam3_00506 [Chlamydiae bacterium]|nr:hypothetical protein [Chlamydiota bacterium]